MGLTTDEPGSEPGEPDKYYPAGKRTYARIVPKDTIQGAALATVMKEDGCTKVDIANDKEVYGAGLAATSSSPPRRQGLTIVANDGIDKNAAELPLAGPKAKAQAPTASSCSGITANNAVQLYKDFAAALPEREALRPGRRRRVRLHRPEEGGIPADVGARTKVHRRDPRPRIKYPPRRPRSSSSDFKAKYGDAQPDPYAIYGYEAMALALDALKRAGDKANDREAVIKALFATKDRDRVLGTYSIDENGDTTLTDYGLYTVEDGELDVRQGRSRRQAG